MRKYIKKYITIFTLSLVFLLSFYGCKESTEQQDTEETQSAEDLDEDLGDDSAFVSGEYIAESDSFKLPLPDGNWTVEREDETGISLQSEDAQSYIEITGLTQDDMEAALGEVPTSKEELEAQISVGEVQPTVEFFERNTEGNATRTTYILKYTDGDYPYMVQSTYSDGKVAYTVIGMTKSADVSVIEGMRDKINQFEIPE